MTIHQNRFKTLVLLILIIIVFSACGHEHEWIEATCISPRTCSTCGEKEGDALGHIWVEASCETPKHCSRCGEERGNSLGGHKMSSWKVTTEPTCISEGSRLATCERCGKKVVETIPKSEYHQIENGTVIQEATCSEEGIIRGVCSVCGQEVESKLPTTEHVSEGIWKIKRPATAYSSGTKAVYCKNCGKEMQEIKYDLSLEEKNAYKSAESYLRFSSGFSRSGLIKQLEYEGYSKEAATLAVDSVEVDWKEEAAKSAKSYMEFSSFSRSGLYNQLQYEGFTKEEIEYGLAAVGY